MNISEFTKDANIKDILIQISDCISELDMLIENVDVLSEEMHTSLINLIEFKTESEQLSFEHGADVFRTKSGMIREFVIRAGEKINDLTDLSDKSIKSINSDSNV